MIWNFEYLIVFTSAPGVLPEQNDPYQIQPWKVNEIKVYKKGKLSEVWGRRNQNLSEVNENTSMGKHLKKCEENLKDIFRKVEGNLEIWGRTKKKLIEIMWNIVDVGEGKHVKLDGPPGSIGITMKSISFKTWKKNWLVAFLLVSDTHFACFGSAFSIYH